MRSWFRVGLRLGVLGGAIFALVVAARSRRSPTAGGGADMATGVHGKWPEVRRAPSAVPGAAPAAEGDHHPHGRVTVPREAAPLGAPPAVATDPPGPTEPEAPEPREHLDAESGSAPAPARKAAARPATAKSTPKSAAKSTPKATTKSTPQATAKSAAKRTGGKNGAPSAGAGALPPWVEPDGKACPPTHPVKAKLASRLYHLPGMLAYDRTTPDRCYVDAEAAEADGFQRSKR